MLWQNLTIGVVQLIVAIILAVISLYIGFAVLSRIIGTVEEEKELARGNVAVGIVIASVFFAIAIVVQSGVAGISNGVSKALQVGLFSLEGFETIGVSILQLILGIVLAVASIYVALNILDRLTKGVDEFEELRKGNVAVALEMAGMIVAVAVIIQSGVLGITNALF